MSLKLRLVPARFTAVLLALAAAAYGQTTSWRTPDFKVSIPGTLQDFFAAGLRPYRFPGLERTLLEVKHLRVTPLQPHGTRLPPYTAQTFEIHVNGGVEALAMKVARAMIIGLRSPLVKRTTGDAYAFVFSNAGNAMPPASIGWFACYLEVVRMLPGNLHAAMNRSTSKILTALLLLLLKPYPGRAAALIYSVTDLTALHGINQEPFHFGRAGDLNNGGDILLIDVDYNDQTGFPKETTVTVARTNGTTTTFPVPYANGFVAEARLNNRGEVAAIVFPDKNNIDLNTREVWTYTATGVPTKLAGMTGVENLSFNDHGQVAVSNTEEDRAFRYTPGVGWENLGSLSNDGFAVPRGINNAGAVTGGTAVGASNTVTPFLYRDGPGMESIPAPFGLGRAINDNFVITGDGGFIYYADEARIAYMLNNQAYGFLRPRDINAMEQIIGASSDGTSSAAFLWDEVNGYQILTNILDDPLSWTVTDTYAINDAGDILAVGYSGRGPPQPDSTYAYLLLHPVPEPGAVAMGLVACCLLGTRRRRGATHPAVC